MLGSQQDEKAQKFSGVLEQLANQDSTQFFNQERLEQTTEDLNGYNGLGEMDLTLAYMNPEVLSELVASILPNDIQDKAFIDAGKLSNFGETAAGASGSENYLKAEVNLLNSMLEKQPQTQISNIISANAQLMPKLEKGLSERGLSNKEITDQRSITFTNNAGPNFNLGDFNFKNSLINSDQGNNKSAPLNLSSHSKMDRSINRGSNISSQANLLNEMDNAGGFAIPLEQSVFSTLNGSNINPNAALEGFSEFSNIREIGLDSNEILNPNLNTLQPLAFMEGSEWSPNANLKSQKRNSDILGGSDFLSTKGQLKSVQTEKAEALSSVGGAELLSMHALNANDLSKTQKLAQKVKSRPEGNMASVAGTLPFDAKEQVEKLDKNGKNISGNSNEISTGVGVSKNQDNQTTPMVRSEMSGSVVQGSMAKNRLSTDSLTKLGTQIHLLKSQGNRGEIRIRMNPESLGEVTLKVMTNGSQVGLQIQASDENSKKILEESISSLKESLASKNLSLSSVDFSVATSSSSQQFQNQSDLSSQAQLMNQDNSGSANREQFSSQYQDARSGETNGSSTLKQKVNRYSGGGAVPVARSQNIAAGRVDVVA